MRRMEYNVADDKIPLVTAASQSTAAVWSVYIGGSIQVRETNAGEIQYRMGEDTKWTFAGMKGAY
jgi:hypothetical protein